MATTEQYVGRSILRKEDAKLIEGQGTFIDNQSMAGMVWMELVRPPYVHAKVDSVDVSKASNMPGVIGVLTAADLDDAFPAGLPMVWPITEDIKIPTHWPLTKDVIRYAGDAVAVVVAESRAQAEDAAEEVAVQAISASIWGMMDRNNPVRPDFTVFQTVRMEFNIKGVSEEQGAQLVEGFKRR